MDLVSSAAEVQQPEAPSAAAARQALSSYSDSSPGHATSSGSAFTSHGQPASIQSARSSITRLRSTGQEERWSSVTPPVGHIRRVDAHTAELDGVPLPLPSPDLNIAMWALGVVPVWRQKRVAALFVGMVMFLFNTSLSIARICESIHHHAGEQPASRGIHAARISIGTLGILLLGYVVTVVNRNEVVIRPPGEQHALRYQVRVLLLMMVVALITDACLKWYSYSFVNAGCNIGLFCSRATVVLLLLENVEQHLEQLNRFLNEVNRGALASVEEITQRYTTLRSSVASTDLRWRWWLLLYTLCDATTVILTMWMVVEKSLIDTFYEAFYANINLTCLYAIFVATHFWAMASLNDSFKNAPCLLQPGENSQAAAHTAFLYLSTRPCKLRVGGISALSRPNLCRVLFSIAGSPLMGYLLQLFLRSARNPD